MVFLLYVAEIFASHSIIKEQRFLQDQDQIATTGPYYKDAWQKLAVEVWKGSQTDPALVDLLKSEGIGVHQGPAPGATPPSTNAAPPTPAPPVAHAPQAPASAPH